MNKNKKISISLKRYHKRKQMKKDIKKIVWIILFLALTGFYIKHFEPIYASENDYAQNTSFPKSADKTNLTVYEERQIVANKIRATAELRNFQYPDYLVNLSCCESLLGSKLENNKGNYPAHSTDKGFFHINDFWHAEVPKECVYDLSCSANWTMDMIENGQQGQWMCDKLIKGKKNYSINFCGVK